MTLSDRNLLVVDDDRDFAESLAEFLDLCGYSVEVVHSGNAAIRRCRERDFDLVLMDVRMPDKDGVESFLEMQQGNPDTRVVLMTAFATPGLISQALSQGVRTTMLKPLVPDRLVEVIEQHRKRRLILLIDDDRDFAQSLAGALQDAGYTVSLAADGDSALEQVADQRPAAILLDLRLPPGSGLEVFRELERRRLQTPTVVVSAYFEDEAETVRELRDGAVAGFVEKPVVPTELLSILASIPRT